MKAIHLYTTYNQFKTFYNENKTERLDKGIKIYSGGSKRIIIKNIKEHNVNEIFDSSLESDYILFKNNDDLEIKFKTYSNNKYRLDLFSYNEFNKNIYHLGFSLWEATLLNYDMLKTNKYEIIEILNRIKYIIKNLKNNNKLKTNDFCIGSTELIKKNKIYKYFLKVVLSENSFEKLKTNLYDEGWGLYFKI
jgi:hypothetical protein